MLLACGAAVVLAGADSFVDAATLSASADATPAEVVVSLLVSMNTLLLVFNLVPAFPLDGGRIARAAAWKLTGDRNRATRFAARIGVGFGWLLILGGLALVVLGDGAAFDGIWFAALGWLLASAARGTLAQTRFTEQLAGITVADVMDAEPVTIPAALPAARAYEDFFLRYQGWEWFAVVEDDGRYAGLAYRAAVEHAALREGGAAPVRELAASAAAESRVSADAPLEALLTSEPLRRHVRAGHARAARAARAVGDLSGPTATNVDPYRVWAGVIDVRRRAGGSGGDQVAVRPASSSASAGISSNWSLDSATRMPASAARRRTSSSTHALQSTIGRSGRRASSRPAASNPSTFGIRASITTTSGASASSCSSALSTPSASPATATGSPASATIARSRKRTSAWSSTIRMRTPVRSMEWRSMQHPFH
jgi:hypothetical protein